MFIQCHYGRRDLAQRLRPTAEVNHLSEEAGARAKTASAADPRRAPPQRVLRRLTPTGGHTLSRDRPARRPSRRRRCCASAQWHPRRAHRRRRAGRHASHHAINRHRRPGAPIPMQFNVDTTPSPAPTATASAIGWRATTTASITCLGGTFLVQDGPGGLLQAIRLRDLRRPAHHVGRRRRLPPRTGHHIHHERRRHRRHHRVRRRRSSAATPSSPSTPGCTSTTRPNNTLDRRPAGLTRARPARSRNEHRRPPPRRRPRLRRRSATASAASYPWPSRTALTRPAPSTARGPHARLLELPTRAHRPGRHPRPDTHQRLQERLHHDASSPAAATPSIRASTGTRASSATTSSGSSPTSSPRASSPDAHTRS